MTQLPPPQQPPQMPPPGIARYGAGVPMQPPLRPKSKVPVWVWILGAFVVVCCVIPTIVGLVKAATGDGKPNAGSSQTSDRPAAVTESAPAPAVTTEAPPPSPEVPAAPVGPKTSFGPGMYEVGVEVKAGTYTCTANGGFGAYWERTKNASGEFDAIIANGNIKAGTQGIVTIKAKEYFKIDRGDCVIR